MGVTYIYGTAIPLTKGYVIRSFEIGPVAVMGAPI